LHRITSFNISLQAVIYSIQIILPTTQSSRAAETSQTSVCISYIGAHLRHWHFTSVTWFDKTQHQRLLALQPCTTNSAYSEFFCLLDLLQDILD